jgi:hypothetical protein
VTRLLMFVGMTAGGYLGWWLGDCMGFGMMGALVVSTLGSAVGVYAAWWVLTRYLN